MRKRGIMYNYSICKKNNKFLSVIILFPKLAFISICFTFVFSLSFSLPSRLKAEVNVSHSLCP